MPTELQRISPDLYADRKRDELWFRTPVGMTMVRGAEVAWYPDGTWAVQLLMHHQELWGNIATGSWSLRK